MLPGIGHAIAAAGSSPAMRNNLFRVEHSMDLGAFSNEADEASAGPASFVAVDPDGNPVLVDQHV